MKRGFGPEQNGGSSHTARPGMGFPIEITTISNNGGPVNKTFFFENCQIKSKGVASIGVGIMRRSHLKDWHDLGPLIEKTPSNEAYLFGVMAPGFPDTVHLVTKDNPRAGSPGYATRTRENLVFSKGPALCFFDLDTKKMPAAVRRRFNEIGGYVDALNHLCPGIAIAGYIKRLSTSAAVYKTETKKPHYEVSGEHLLLLVADGTDIPRFLTAMNEWAWLTGLGWIEVGAIGQKLERSIVDVCCGVPERIDFEADPTIDPSAQKLLYLVPRKADVHDGEPFDTKALKDLTLTEKGNLQHIKDQARRAAQMESQEQLDRAATERAAKTGRTVEDMRAALKKASEAQVLLPPVELTFVDGRIGTAAAGDVLANPQQFDGQELYDPIEGTEYGHHTAKLYVRTDGSVAINSFAHGCRAFVLRWDFESIKAAIEAAPEDKADKILHARIIHADIDPADEDRLIDLAKKRSHVSKPAIKATIKDKKKQSSKAAAAAASADPEFLGVLDKAIEEFNEEMVWIYPTGCGRQMFDYDLGRSYWDFRKTATMREAYANRFVLVPVKDEEVKVNLFDAWLKSERRRQYMGGVTFHPSTLPRLYSYEPVAEQILKKEGVLPEPYTAPVDLFNLWTGFAVEPKQGGSWQKLQDHMLNVVCDGNVAAFLYLYQWMAYCVQFPDRQGEVAIVMRGDEGTGKGILGRAFRHLFGRHGLHIQKPGQLVGRFNDHLKDCVLLFADEAFYAGNPEHVECLKVLITEPTTAIEGKFREVVDLPNRLHIMMASNATWTVHASLDARRFLVLDVNSSKIGDTEYFNAIMDELKNGGYEQMLFDLLLTHPV